MLKVIQADTEVEYPLTAVDNILTETELKSLGRSSAEVVHRLLANPSAGSCVVDINGENVTVYADSFSTLIIDTPTTITAKPLQAGNPGLAEVFENNHPVLILENATLTVSKVTGRNIFSFTQVKARSVRRAVVINTIEELSQTNRITAHELNEVCLIDTTITNGQEIVGSFLHQVALEGVAHWRMMSISWQNTSRVLMSSLRR